MTTEEQRKEFEAEFTGRLNLERLNLGAPVIGFDTDFADSNTNFAWIGWQAARNQSNNVPVAEIRWIKHLEGKASEFHEYGASEGKRLPVGTKLFTYQPHANELLEMAAKIADECSGDGINPACAEVASRIRSLIPHLESDGK